MCPTDPNIGSLIASVDSATAMSQRLIALTKRVEALERQATVQAGSGTPTQAARDGTMYVDTVGFWLYVRAAGTWRHTALS